MYQGKSVVLRPIERRDLEVLRALANDPTTRAMVGGWGWPIAEQAQALWLERAISDERNHRLVVCRIDDSQRRAVGLCGLWDVDWQARSAQSAVKLVDRGRHPDRPDGPPVSGIGRDAVLTSLSIGFGELGLHRIWASINAFNHPSLRLYREHCGFKVEGQRRDAVYRKGRFHDVFDLGILRSEWEARPETSEYLNRLCPVDVNPPQPSTPPAPFRETRGSAGRSG